MTALRALLFLMFVAIALYTIAAATNDGLNLAAYFFGDIAKFGWPGQFNLDFMFLLMLAGLWVAWRHKFSPAGLALGLSATVLGVVFLSIYLLIASVRTSGDIRRILLGEQFEG